MTWERGGGGVSTVRIDSIGRGLHFFALVSFGPLPFTLELAKAFKTCVLERRKTKRGWLGAGMAADPIKTIAKKMWACSNIFPLRLFRTRIFYTVHIRIPASGGELEARPYPRSTGTVPRTSPCFSCVHKTGFILYTIHQKYQ
jgi:hypothetical protein